MTLFMVILGFSPLNCYSATFFIYLFDAEPSGDNVLKGEDYFKSDCLL